MQNKVGTRFPIVECIKNKDMRNPDNWEPCILKKVRKETYEVLSNHDNGKVEGDLVWGRDDVLHRAWTLYSKYLDKKCVASFVADAEQTQLDVEALDFSPRCPSLCSKVTKNVTNKA